MKEFILPIRVYYEDTDSGGLVYHANYLKFMERARTEWLRARGFEQDRLLRDYGVLFAVRDLQIEYRRPAFFNDLLEVTALPVTTGHVSLSFEQAVRREADSQQLIHARVRVACLDAATLRPASLPEPVRGELE